MNSRLSVRVKEQRVWGRLSAFPTEAKWKWSASRFGDQYGANVDAERQSRHALPSNWIPQSCEAAHSSSRRYCEPPVMTKSIPQEHHKNTTEGTTLRVLHRLENGLDTQLLRHNRFVSQDRELKFLDDSEATEVGRNEAYRQFRI